MTKNNGVNVIFSARFLRSAKRLPAEIQKKLEKRSALFKNNPFDPQLGTHKLHGELQGFWAYSVDYHYRVVFVFNNKKITTYYDIGTHAIYQ